jgi:oligopeptide/dipeptide ABC transporter ATP-binding protein
MQIVFQDPFGSLNPRLTVERVIDEPLLNHEDLSGAERRARVEEALVMVGLSPEHMTRFPHEFSGGQRQRICVARALVLRPRLVIGDEPVSALDVSVRAQVLNLMVKLQRQLNLSYLFISHDLAVIRYVSHRVGVMYLGQIVELAGAKTLYAKPLHPYTWALLSAVPLPDPRRARKRIILEGDVPSPMNPPAGCRFHPRCTEVMPICREQAPSTRVVENNHLVRCHLYDDAEVWNSDLPAPLTRAGSNSTKGGNA